LRIERNCVLRTYVNYCIRRRTTDERRLGGQRGGAQQGERGRGDDAEVQRILAASPMKWEPVSDMHGFGVAVLDLATHYLSTQLGVAGLIEMCLYATHREIGEAVVDQTKPCPDEAEVERRFNIIGLCAHRFAVWADAWIRSAGNLASIRTPRSATTRPRGR
jgi:hypothetical protein